MRIRWRNFELPSSVDVDMASKTDRYACFTIEPFEKGFGHTIGNGLRRVLLSSIEGTAVTNVKIEGVLHEFTTIPGVLEDMTEVVLNLKGLLVGLDEGMDEVELTVSRDKAGELKASEVVCPAGAQVLDGDHVLCTLTDDVEVRMTITVRQGRGYITAEEHSQAKEEQELGVIDIDSNFSPVERVRYRVEETRVGKITNYDRLVLEIWSDGTVDPEEALVEASRIYRKHLNAFVHFREMGKLIPADETRTAMETPVESDEVRGLLNTPIEELDLSVRSRHCLDSENILTVGELVRRTEQDLLKVRNFGRTSLNEIKKKLATMGLELGMNVGAEPQGAGAES